MDLMCDQSCCYFVSTVVYMYIKQDNTTVILELYCYILLAKGLPVRSLLFRFHTYEAIVVCTLFIVMYGLKGLFICLYFIDAADIRCLLYIHFFVLHYKMSIKATQYTFSMPLHNHGQYREVFSLI